LGELDLSNIQILTNRLTKVAENSKSFKVDIGGLGGFPNIKRPHTLWTAIGRSLPELKKLRNELHNELANWGLVLEERKYKPYISLASRPKLEGIDLSEVLFKKLGEFIIVEVVLFESKVINGSIVYNDLHRASLK